jgi:hypothetical protein
MSTQAAVSGNAYKNNGGTIKKAGSASTTTGPITSARTLMQDAAATQYGSKVVLSSGSTGSSGNVGTANAVTNFAYQMVAGRYIMKKNTSYVNGSANTFLTSCASDVGGKGPVNPARLETARALGSGYLTSWDYETGAITKGANAGQTMSFGNDHAARPSDATPGELTYKTGSPTPTDWQDDYKPRTG